VRRTRLYQSKPSGDRALPLAELLGSDRSGLSVDFPDRLADRSSCHDGESVLMVLAQAVRSQTGPHGLQLT